MAEKEASPPNQPKPESTSVIVRAYPKIVYLYLTWLASIVCGLLQPAAEVITADGALRLSGEGASMAFTLGRVWMAIFIFNMLVIAFEFSRIRSVAIAFFIIAFIFAALHFEFLGSVGDFLGGLELMMNKVFYFTFAAVFTLIYLLVYINTRFSYWEIQPNEILHHHGFLGDVNRYPTRGLRMKKEISDVMEAILLRAGTLVLNPEGVDRPILLENVINISRVAEKIQRLLGTLKVRIDQGRIGGDD